MLVRVDHILQQNCHLRPGNLLLVGVSGGADSLCLLEVLVQLGYPVVVAHLNHGLRSESRSDADFVESIARAACLRFVVGEEDVATYARVHSLSLEEAARNVRYEFLFKQAELAGAQAVAVAHTADDQIETVLMHFLRGTGLSGLRGMQYYTLPSPWCGHIPLIRPLLDTWREEIQKFLKDRGMTPVEDLTNLDTRIFRNRLRHELIPYLASYNPSIRQAIQRMAWVLDADYQVIKADLDSAWEDCRVDLGEGYVSFQVSAMQIQPEGIRRHLIRKGISCLLPGLRDIDFCTVDRAVRFLDQPTRSRNLELAANIYLLLEGNLLWIATRQAVLPVKDFPQIQFFGCQTEFPLPVPGAVNLAEGWCIQAEIIRNFDALREEALKNEDPFQAWIDLEHIPLPLVVRARRAGDRIAPLGMAGKSMKVTDLMINLKTPARARKNWPLVYAGNHLVWVPGLRQGNVCRISGDTSQAVRLRLVKGEITPDD